MFVTTVTAVVAGSTAERTPDNGNDVLADRRFDDGAAYDPSYETFFRNLRYAIISVWQSLTISP
jgi:hypothetical protein